MLPFLKLYTFVCMSLYGTVKNSSAFKSDTFKYQNCDILQLGQVPSSFSLEDVLRLHFFCEKSLNIFLKVEVAESIIKSLSFSGSRIKIKSPLNICMLTANLWHRMATVSLCHYFIHIYMDHYFIHICRHI